MVRWLRVVPIMALADLGLEVAVHYQAVAIMVLLPALIVVVLSFFRVIVVARELFMQITVVVRPSC